MLSDIIINYQKRIALNNISSIYRVKGDYNTALDYLTQSLKIQQAIGDNHGEGVTLNNLGSLKHSQNSRAINQTLQFLKTCKVCHTITIVSNG
jgi:tetratricopeptide (TPR) repeat protein